MRKLYSVVLLLVLSASFCLLTACKKSVTVQFMDGDSTINTVSVEVGGSLDMPSTPKKDNFRFIGWFYNENCTERVEFPIVIEENTSIYAGWEGQYSITFSSEGGSVPQSIVGFGGDYLSDEPIPVWEGHRFDGWYEDTDYKKHFQFYAGRQMYSRDLVLYAKWSKVWSISFNCLDSNVTVEPIIAEYNEAVTQPESPIREGYVFEGWFTDDTLATEYQFGYMDEEDVVVYAKWRAVNAEVLVTFILSDGTNITKTLVEGEAILDNSPSDQDALDKLGTDAQYFIFDGYVDANGSRVELVPKHDIVLYPRFIRDASYALITFKVNGSSQVTANRIFIKKGASLTAAAIAVSGNNVSTHDYIFVRSNGDIFDATLNVYSDEEIELLYFKKGSANLEYSNILDGNSNVIGKTVTGSTDNNSIFIPPYHDGHWVTHIADNAFNGKAVADIIIGSKITSIGKSAFANNVALASITLPLSVAELHSGVFSGCTSLSTVVFEGKDAVNIVRFDNDVFGGTPYIVSKEANGVVILENSILYSYNVATSSAIFSTTDKIKVIAGGAFMGQRNLQKLVVSSSVVYIGESAFSGCDGLVEVVLNCSLTEISESCFYGTSALKSVVLPSTVTAVRANAFRDSGVQSVVLSADLIAIESYAFNNCQSLSEVNFAEAGKLASISDFAFAGTALVKVGFADALERIGVSAFSNCTSLIGVDLGQSDLSKLTTIGASAFLGSDGIKRVIIRTRLDTGISFADNTFPKGKNITFFIISGQVILPDGKTGTATYNAVYTALFTGLSYSSADYNLLPHDKTAPTIKILTSVNAWTSGAVNVMDYLQNTGIVSVSESVTFNVTRVTFNSVDIQPNAGSVNVYSFVSVGTYVVYFTAEDLFGNVRSAYLEIKVSILEI